MGYTPLFDSLTKGSLCGKWPDIGLWPVVLSMADWRGEIQATHGYISKVTGLPIEEVTACMTRFCEPDPTSRSSNDDGRRLILLNEAAGWGWRVVNIQKYRDMASGAEQVADGRNAAKVRRYKEGHRETPADTEDTGGHRQTPTHTADSDSDSDSDSESESEKTKSKRGGHRGHRQTPADTGGHRQTPKTRAQALATHTQPDGLNAEAWNRWEAYRREVRKPIKPASVEAAQIELAKFGDEQAAVVQQSIANSYQGLFALKANGFTHARAGPPIKLRTADEIEASERARGEQ